jgi:Domain of unknown function (DUF2804), C-terminal
MRPVNAQRGSAVQSAGVPVPPAAMRMFRDRRPLKRWRYVGAYGPELMLCAGDARIGPLRQRFWALATPDGRIRERTALLGSGGVRIAGPEVAIDAPDVRARVRVDETPGVETLSGHGGSYIWTSKQGGARVHGLVEVDGVPHQLDCRGIVDDSAGYHARHTVWKWSAGVGTTGEGRPVAWNLVTGVHDDPRASERSVWLDGEPSEVGPVEFEDDLSKIRFSEGGELEFTEWAAREDNTNALLLKSWYRQPFGTFKGTLPGGLALSEGYGVMESHDVWW